MATTKEAEPMIAATMFSGIGAPECAMPHWNWRWCAEIENFPRAVLAARHPHSINLGDVNAEDFVARAESVGGRPDVVVFGSPCQDFSVAGRRVGLDGDRGNLALVALGIVNKLRPRWMVFENVPGLLSSRSGSAEAERAVREGPVGARADGDEDSDFAAFLALVQQCGYLGCYRVTDAQYAGVPQRRRRIFAVFHLGDWRPAAAVLFEPEGLRGDHPPSRETGQGIAPTISARPTGGGGLGTDFDLDGGLIESAVEQRIARPLSAARGIASAHREDMETYIPVAGTLDAAGSKSRGAGTPVGMLIPDGPDGAVSSKWSKGTGGPAGDECYNLVAQPVAFGGNNTAGPIDVATARNAHGSPAVRQDFESETFVVTETSPTLRAGGNKTGGDRPPGTDVDTADSLVVYSFADRLRGDDGRGYDREPAFRTDGAPTLDTVKPPVVAFDTTQITSPHNRSQPDDRSPQLTQSGQPAAIAFDCKAGGDTSFSIGEQTGALRASHGGGHAAIAFSSKDYGGDAAIDQAPTLRAMGSEESHANGGGQIAVFKPSHFTRGKDGAPSGVSPPLGAEPDKGDQDPLLMTGTAVRPLTPRECERLQAFPDDYTLIRYRGADAADGPRYKALGNAMNVNEVRWVLQRIELFEQEKAKW